MHVAKLLISVLTCLVHTDDTNFSNTVPYASTISFICNSSIIHEQRCHCFCSVLLVGGDMCSTGKTVNFMQWFVTALCHKSPARASKISCQGEITGVILCILEFNNRQALFIYLFICIILGAQIAYSDTPLQGVLFVTGGGGYGGYITHTLCGLTVEAHNFLSFKTSLASDFISKCFTLDIWSYVVSTL